MRRSLHVPCTQRRRCSQLRAAPHCTELPLHTFKAYVSTFTCGCLEALAFTRCFTVGVFLRFLSHASSSSNNSFGGHVPYCVEQPPHCPETMFCTLQSAEHNMATSTQCGTWSPQSAEVAPGNAEHMASSAQYVRWSPHSAEVALHSGEQSKTTLLGFHTCH